MEEADILGDKIAIMKGGRVATVGTSLRLKNRFGSGYSISIVAKSPENIPGISNFVTACFRKAETVRFPVAPHCDVSSTYCPCLPAC